MALFSAVNKYSSRVNKKFQNNSNGNINSNYTVI